MKLTGNPTLYLFTGSNGAGKTTFARAYLRQLDPIPRFLNADEIARGLSPLAPKNSPSKPANSCSTKSKAAWNPASPSVSKAPSAAPPTPSCSNRPNPSVFKSRSTTSGFPLQPSPSAESPNASKWEDIPFQSPM